MEGAYISYELAEPYVNPVPDQTLSCTSNMNLPPVETVDKSHNMNTLKDEINVCSTSNNTKQESSTSNSHKQECNKEDNDQPTDIRADLAQNREQPPPKLVVNPAATMSEEECVQKIISYLDKLHKLDSLEFEKYVEEIKFLRCFVLLSNKHQSKKNAGLKELARNGFVLIFRKFFQQNISRPFDEVGFEYIFNNLYGILVTLWNGTDASTPLCQAIVDEKLYQDLFVYLDHDMFLPEKLENNKKKTTVVKGCLGILHNVIQKCDVRGFYRDCDAVRILEKVRRSKGDMVKSKAMMVLSYVINEDEYEKLNSDDNVIEFLMTILKDTLKSDTHHSKKYGYRTSEIIDVLITLAANDMNKERIVKHDGIKYLTNLMQNSASQAEQAKAARAIWTLAFKAKDEILKENECIKALKVLEESDDVEVKKQATGALWVLQGKHTETYTSEKNYLQGDQQKHTGSDTQHIMISYQWDNQAIMIQIRDRLQAAGYKVWMDIDKMSGSILEAMAKAIEDASVVLVCMSQKYKESPNCRTEGNYAYAKHKTIIPLRMQYRYSPDGWLGALVGNLLYFDFSVEQKFEPSLKKLLKEVSDKINIGNGDITAVTVPETGRLPSSVVPTNKEVYKGWDTNRVHTWLTDNKLEFLIARFSLIDGSLLYEYKLMMQEAPEFFFKTLETSLRLSLPEMLMFTKALRQL